ncbi:WD40-repeat-containing domain protein [Lentinula edodes]|nr:WD40-repeat-containing domain protein [Lentinula edodes]
MSSSKIPVRTLPIVTVQPTFPIVVNEVYSGVIPFENIWISCYNNSSSDSPAPSSSIHSKVRVVLDDEDREKVVYQVREGDVNISEAERRDFGYIYSVSSPSLRIPPTRLLFPVQEYADPEKSNPQKPHRITAFSLAPDKSQYAIGYLDGSVLLYPSVPIQNSQSEYPTSATSGLSPALTRAHRSTVTSLRFFPSSRVLLSSGADFALQVYPADPIAAASVSSASGQSSKRVSSVRTLTAHTRSVTSSAMIGRGRAIISSSMDGTIRVWDVSTGEEETLVHSAAGVGIGINRIFLDSDRDLSSSEDAEPSSNGRLYAALHDGSFEVFTLDGSQKPRKLVHEFRSEKSIYGALNAITVSMPTAEAREKFIAVGSAQGVISIYNASSYASVHFRRNEASIEDLDFVPLPQSKLGLVITTGDGLPWIASLDELPITGSVDAKVSVYAELVGGDVDAVRNVSVHTVSSTIEVWTASDDGIVRRYVL